MLTYKIITNFEHCLKHMKCKKLNTILINIDEIFVQTQKFILFLKNKVIFSEISEIVQILNKF